MIPSKFYQFRENQPCHDLAQIWFGLEVSAAFLRQNCFFSVVASSVPIGVSLSTLSFFYCCGGAVLGHLGLWVEFLQSGEGRFRE
jgi:hypothetical protein